MSALSQPMVASLAAKAMQRLVVAGQGRSKRRSPLARFPDVPRDAFELSIPTSIAPARAVVYLPAKTDGNPPPVHVNFHGGGYVMPLLDGDDPLCRFLAADAGVAVINVDYVLAPQHPFPAAPRQAFEVVRWAASHGAQHGWDGTRLTVGGQSAGGGLAAAVARQALEEGGPALALQVLHYPPLDLATSAKDKRASIPKPFLRPWMAEIFDSSYVPDRQARFDRLVSPANPADDEDLTGIAPALVITAAFDLLKAEGARYADRLRRAGALVEHHDVSDADHGYDGEDDAKARAAYSLIARHVHRATTPEEAKAP
ncbi:alpha/beta hydrolase [Phycicoccus sp. Soil802]|uniref:alpha/beta hydrolase n=1 Tax=Phycicoccus sp. Soil802 TaxID=1736414 RepID=UPI0007027E9E|nr:alpha/beta hydrolase [Phycicoccus sp. Soil802]KRF22300.1 carboxylesterase [Phycicoccus sp. Soil802]